MKLFFPRVGFFSSKDKKRCAHLIVSRTVRYGNFQEAAPRINAFNSLQSEGSRLPISLASCCLSFWSTRFGSRGHLNELMVKTWEEVVQEQGKHRVDNLDKLSITSISVL